MPIYRPILQDRTRAVEKVNTFDYGEVAKINHHFCNKTGVLRQDNVSAYAEGQY